MSQLQHTAFPARPSAPLREAKRIAAEAIGIDRDFVSTMVEEFYASVRADALLGPIFQSRIGNWPEHLDRMKRFWRSVLHNSGEFSGNPMAKHIAIPGLAEEHFARWLELFYVNLQSIDGSPEAIRLVGDRARMIAESLLTGIVVDREGIDGAAKKRNLPHV